MADVKLSYPTATTLTINVAGLSSDTNLLIGRESDTIDNTSNKYLDVILSGKFQVATSGTLTAGRAIQVFAVASLDGTNYPDVFTGSNSGKTLTSANVKNAICKYVAEMVIDVTNSVYYSFSGVSLASVFGGTLPPKVQLFVVHNTAQALSGTAGTAGNHVIYMQPVIQTVT